MLGGDPLDRLNDDFFRLGIGALLRFVDDVLGLSGRHGTCFALDLFDHGRLCFVCRHATQLLECFDGLGVIDFQVLLLFVDGLKPLFKLFLVA